MLKKDKFGLSLVDRIKLKKLLKKLQKSIDNWI